MPFLRQAPGVKLRPSNAVLCRFSIRFASHSNKHKKSHVARDSEAKVRPDRDEVGQGKRQKSFWKSIAPDFLTQETNASLGRGGHFTQTSAFKLYASHSPGSKPIVEASSSSWDSKTNEVSHTVYDPISGRMVPATSGQSRQTSILPKSKKDSHNESRPHEKPTIVSQLPENNAALSNAPTTHASFTEDFDKTYQSEHDELLAARRHLDTLREQIQILERQTHPEMVKPYVVDAERPAVFEGGWDDNPKGLQTAFKLEKEACEHGDMKPLEQEMDALNKTPTQEVSDDHSIAPSGLETLFADEKKSNDIGHKSSLEQELVAMNTEAPPIDDGYSPSPQSLETMFAQEQHNAGKNEYKTLEDEVQMTGSAAGQPQYVDGFTKEPIGLETMFEQEHNGTPQRLEHELENMASSPSSSDQHDAYSTKPIGTQTHFERESQGNQKKQHKDLEHEVHDHIQALDDYSSANLDGMQALWKREQKDVETGSARSLEDEITAKQQPQAISHGCDTSAFGMETHFRDEAQKIRDSGRSLEEDLKLMEEASYHEDGYSRAPIGMENSFEKEVKDESTSLEADLKDMPGEGDLSPTVGKFANRAQWYKQPARSTFSEDYPKAEVRKPDQQTAICGRSLDDGSPNSIKSSVPTADIATATEHLSTPTTSINDRSESSLNPESGSNIKWREPALYKVIAYDSSKDTIAITITPSKFSDSETPLSIPQAVSQLALAARFLPYIAASQNEGFQVIHAEKDYLVSRLVHKDRDPETPRHEAVTNPIDGTTRYTPFEPPSARFASPTGFVNYEPIFPTEAMHNRQNRLGSFFGNGHPDFQQHTFYPNPPHIPAKPDRSIFRHADAKFRKEKRRRWRRRIGWVMSVAAGTAVCTTYVVGVSGELARSEKRIAQPTR